jgi:membrane protease YdiL (CAAX protease family)
VVVLRVVGVVLGYLMASSVLFTVGTLLLPSEVVGGPAGLALLAVPSAGGIGVVLAAARWLDGRPIATLGLEPRGAVGRWLRGGLVAMLLMGLIVGVSYSLVDQATWTLNPDAGRAAVALVAGLVGFLVQGPSEEILLRGYVLQIVAARWSLTWAIGASAVLFGVLHAFNSGFGPLPLVNLVLFGVAAGLYKVWVDRDQLWGVFALHSVWNWLQQVVFGLENSGNASPAANTLFHLQPDQRLPAPAWGGGFGPEGTLAATVVLLALVGRLVLLARRA